MAFFDGIPCPVCGNPFSPDDDVVVCPDCGTPHHRDCWTAQRHCVNELRHKEGFTFERPVAVKLPDPAGEPAPGGPAAAPQAVSNTTACPGCGYVYDNGCTFCPKCGLRRQQSAAVPPAPGMQPPFFSPAAPIFAGQQNQKIDGESVADIAQAVGPNAQRYIPIFLRQEERRKKTGWNWCAFLFGGYWYLSRKNYLAGAVALLLQLAATLPFNIMIQKLPGYSSIYDSLMNPQSYLTPNTQIEAFYSKALPYMLAMSALSLLLRVFFGLFADSIYKKRILQVVRQERAAYETSKLTSPVAITYGNIQLNPHDVYYAMLSRRGGMNLFAVLGGMLLYQLGGSAVLTLLLS